MNAKTARFEMRLDEDIVERVDSWREAQGGHYSRAEAIRQLVDQGLAIAGERPKPFTDGERLLLHMVSDIQEKLGIDDGVPSDLVKGVLYGGHDWALDWELNGIFHGHRDSRESVQHVVDVMDMWSFIEEGYEDLTEEEKARLEVEAEPFGKHVEFTGWDGNNESELMSIARFLVDDMDRFSRFQGRDLNSHCPMTTSYRRMYAEFNLMRPNLVGVRLSVDQISKLLQAKRGPH